MHIRGGEGAQQSAALFRTLEQDERRERTHLVAVGEMRERISIDDHKRMRRAAK